MVLEVQLARKKSGHEAASGRTHNLQRAAYSSALLLWLLEVPQSGLERAPILQGT